MQNWITHCCQINSRFKGNETQIKIGKYTLQQVIVYILSLSFPTPSMPLFVAPFVVTWDPMQKLFSTNWIVK